MANTKKCMLCMKHIPVDSFNDHFRDCLSQRVNKDKRAKTQRRKSPTTKKDCGCHKKKQKKS